MSLTTTLSDLAGIVLTVSSKSVTGYDVDAAPSLITKTPARILNLLQMDDGATYHTLGRGSKTENYTIEDICFWQSVVAGSTLATMQSELLDYIEAYKVQIKSLAFTGTVTVEELTFQPGIYEYPRKSKKEYYAVRVELKLKEVF